MSRNIELLHEQNTPAGVAQEVAGNAIRTINRFLPGGKLTLGRTALLRLPAQHQIGPFPNEIRFRTPAHRLIFTGRPIKDGSAGYSDTLTEAGGTRIENSLIVVRYSGTDFLGSQAMRATLGNMGHTLGLEDCKRAATACVMGRDVIRVNESPAQKPDALLTSGRPFCESCMGKLATAQV